jgi:hypothetical protein
MHPRLGRGPHTHQPPLGLRLARYGALSLPCLVLVAGAALQFSVRPGGTLWLGGLLVLGGCVLATAAGRSSEEPVGPAVLILYVVALSWLLLASDGVPTWFLHLAQSLLLVVPLGLFGAQCLQESGASSLRRARLLAQRLAHRADWPADLAACRLLPEVKALREALVDASPALALLGSPRPELRVAALASLEFRAHWRYGQADVVLHLARNSPEPEVRSAAVYALANVEDRLLTEALAEFLRDPSGRVRRAAAEALLWDTEAHWPWIRDAARRALADPVCKDDGPLRGEGHLFAPEAVADLTAWASEMGLLGLRAAVTLGDHYARTLAAGHDPALVRELRRQVVDAHAPTALRVELARLLQTHRELDAGLLHRLIDPSAPAPLRLIGVEALLARGDAPEAVAALHELGRLPNREIALATAEVVQRRLGVELGVPRGQPLPPVHSRAAAEVARRLMRWATQSDVPDGEPADPVLEEPGWRTLGEI